MKTIFVTFAVLLFLLTLLGSFGGSIRTTEPFFDAVPAVKEEQLLRGPTMVNQINDVLNMATNGVAPHFEAPPAAESYTDLIEYEPPMPQFSPEQPLQEAFYEEKIDMYVPEPFENGTDAVAPF